MDCEMQRSRLVGVWCGAGDLLEEEGKQICKNSNEANHPEGKSTK